MIEILVHSLAPEASTDDYRGGHRVSVAARQRIVPIVMILVTVGAAMAYWFLWGPVVQHRGDWLITSDIWGTFRTAQFVSWGDIGDIYRSGGGLVSPPGISLVMAPVALVIDHLGLSIGFPIGIPHPTAWLVLGPYVAIVGSIVLLPLDAIAQELGLNRTRRALASVAGAVILWPLIALWGHPEDSLALGFALWALLQAMRGNWRPAGWLFGLAIVMQPVVGLMLPVIMATAPMRQWGRLVIRSVIPTVLVVAVPLVQSWRQTTTALLKQPGFPDINHPTPWFSLAPVLSKPHMIPVAYIHQTTLATGVSTFAIVIRHAYSGEIVAAGPGRLIAIGLALLLGFHAYRRRPTREQLVWLCCMALALRCVFEAVMVPYYLWPSLAIAVVLMVRDSRRFAVGAASIALLTWWSYRYVGPWDWWLPVTALLGVAVGVARPTRSAILRPSRPTRHAYWATWHEDADGEQGTLQPRESEMSVSP